MPAEIRDGWLHGELEDDNGRAWPILRFPESSARGELGVSVPNLVLHTTETYNPELRDDGYVEDLRFPSQWQCGNAIVGQHIRLGLAGDALNTWDLAAQQIEMVANSKLGLWLPVEDTLGPTVALTAWLHRTNRIKTGLKRPDGQDWPVVLDRGPQATMSYYRRHAGLWPHVPGVYGHVDIPSNSHWDPGSFNYPVFFRRVAAAIRVQEGDDMTDEEKAKLNKLWNFLNGVDEVIDPDEAINAAALGRAVGRAVRNSHADEPPVTDALTKAEADELYAPKSDHPHTATTAIE